MKRASVAVVKGEYSSGLSDVVLDMVEADKLVCSRDKVLIKPNCVVAKHPSTGLTTDARVVEDIIKFVKRLGVDDVVVAEGGAGRTTDRAFEIGGMKEVATRQQVDLIDLNQEPRVAVKVAQPLKLQQVAIAEAAYRSTCIINVPTLKVHHLTFVTLSMKNLMGTLLPKNVMHGDIDAKIVDLVSVFKDKVKLNVVDGLIGAETDEVRGTPVEMNLLIAGSDMVAVDTVSTAIMGIDPRKVPYLQLAAQRGLGISDLHQIEILGEEIADVKRVFKLPAGHSRVKSGAPRSRGRVRKNGVGTLA
jgi:uncharacterized protein (DUF362 family)